MSSAETAVWTAGQVARHLGIAESTLRSWHRRYHLGPDNRPARGYRRYTPEDVTRLQRMCELVKSGMLPSDAARNVATGNSTHEQDLTDVLRAARELNSARCVAVLNSSLDQYGVLPTWDNLCRPALTTVNDDRFNDPTCVANEHILSWAVSAVLHRVQRPETEPDVLLACAEGEYHTLALEALAAALSERGTAVRMLGAATPADSLVEVAKTVRPTAVVLWSQQSSTANENALAQLRPHVPRAITAGPGWTDPHTEHCTDLTHAVTLLTSDRQPIRAREQAK
jgi:DNA-binding transcriptional MerR regulator